MILTCKDCNLEKDSSEFSAHKTSKTGFSSNCKLCYNNRRRERYKDPEVSKGLEEYRKENSERNIEYQKAYREANKEKLKEARKARDLAKKLSKEASDAGL